MKMLPAYFISSPAAVIEQAMTCFRFFLCGGGHAAYRLRDAGRRGRSAADFLSFVMIPRFGRARDADKERHIGAETSPLRRRRAHGKARGRFGRMSRRSPGLNYRECAAQLSLPPLRQHHRAERAIIEKAICWLPTA